MRSDHEGDGEGAARCLLDLYKNGNLDGVTPVGRNQGTAMASMAVCTLPISFPKLMMGFSSISVLTH
jgi:uncharacterized protein (UPF0261 family)